MSHTALGDDVESLDGMSERSIADYLSKHPSFLKDHPELLDNLIPPSAQTGKGVLDMQVFVIGRLQDSIRSLRAEQVELLASHRDHRSTASRVHAAVLALYEPGAMNDLVELIKTDLPTILEADIASLCVEFDDSLLGPLPASGGVSVVEQGLVESLIGIGRDVALEVSADAMDVVFGSASSLVKSAALIRLAVGGPTRPAMLGLGSRDFTRFQKGQCTELYAFLGQAMGRRLREWLDTTI